VVTALALSFLGPGALVAAGDDGPSRPVATDRPTTRTSIRPTELSDPRPLPPSNKTVVMLVSGIASNAYDPTFDAIVSALLADPRYEVHRFGGDPAHPYDTLGSINANADQLTAQIRELAKTHPKIEIVAHSMGGVVVDAAFRRGLSAGDKVETYIALASPHDGSTVARIGETFLDIADRLGIKAEFREVSARFGHDLGAPAVKDLAETHAAPPPPGVNRVDVRIATDGIVIGPDARNPGITERTLLPSGVSLEGHGGATIDPRVLEIITSTIASRRPPATDWREQVLERAASVVSAIVPLVVVPLVCLAMVGGLCAAGYLWMRRRRPEFGLP
jgi:hypothetical protein